jgi:glyoxylate reductase
VFVTRRIPEAGLALLRQAGAEVSIGCEDEERGPTGSELLAGVRRADVLLPLLTEPVDEELLAANPRLRGVANYAVGYDNIDLERLPGWACRSRTRRACSRKPRPILPGRSSSARRGA